MAVNDPIPTDSARTLRDLAGNDATATFENDPNFVDSDPGGTASSENLGAAKDVDETDAEDDIADVDEDDEDLEDDFEEEDDDEDEDDEDEDDDDEDDDDEDEDDDDALEAGKGPGLLV
jgi:hypothetical protein